MSQLFSGKDRLYRNMPKACPYVILVNLTHYIAFSLMKKHSPQSGANDFVANVIYVGICY